MPQLASAAHVAFNKLLETCSMKNTSNDDAGSLARCCLTVVRGLRQLARSHIISSR